MSRMRKVIKLFLLLKNKFYFKSVFKSVAAGIEHEKILKNIGVEYGHIVDIGANRGQFSLVSRYCFPKAKIDSFEPLAEPAAFYKKVFEYDDNVTLHSYAIGEECAALEIHISNRDDSSSLLPISEMQSVLFKGTSEKSTRIIDVAPLDVIISAQDIISPALLKIDVQGFELSVLKGCLNLLNTFKNIYVECSFVELYEGQSFADEVIEFLARHNFRLIGIYNIYYDKHGNSIQADFLFENRKL